MAIDLDAKTYVEFWTYSPMTLCGPSCPAGVTHALLTSRDAVRAAAHDELLHLIKDRTIPRTALELRDTQ